MLLKKILSTLNGLRYSQEYLCLAKESFKQQLCGYIIHNNKVAKDITKLHLFVGYCPVVFAFAPNNIKSEEIINISFSHVIYQPSEVIREKDVIAVLQMKKIYEFITDQGIVYLYEAFKGKHSFISTFNQLVIQINNWLYNRKPGNVYLENNLYKQVQVAYSIPRAICFISLGFNHKFNLFPTDLHGQISSNYYLISLRHTGKACRQVELTKRILISTTAPEAFRDVYSLGKNHMQELKSKEEFNFSDDISDKLHIPIPKNIKGYRELKLISSYQHGIHKIHLFRIINTKELNSNIDTLAHIHVAYGTWRINHGLSGNYLIR